MIMRSHDDDEAGTRIEDLVLRRADAPLSQSIQSLNPDEEFLDDDDDHDDVLVDDSGDDDEVLEDVSERNDA
jgi:hypothetical protein